MSHFSYLIKYEFSQGSKCDLAKQANFVPKMTAKQAFLFLNKWPAIPGLRNRGQCRHCHEAGTSCLYNYVQLHCFTKRCDNRLSENSFMIWVDTNNINRVLGNYIALQKIDI